jgi:hypothetical protein
MKPITAATTQLCRKKKGPPEHYFMLILSSVLIECDRFIGIGDAT